MVASHPCGSCTGLDLPILGILGPAEPDHCQGRSDRPAPKGILGGYRCSCPCRDWPREGHMRWWEQAEHEHPNDPDARAERYVYLMRQAGLIVPREPGQSVNLPCGWPHRPEPDDVVTERQT